MFDFLNSRLSLSWRVALAAACAAPPVALLLYLFVGQTLQESRFTELELKGAAYIAEVWPAIVSGGAPALPNSGPEAGEARSRFHASEEEKAFLAADQGGRTSAGAALIQAVADGSNLTLDTDLGSFYAMDAATVALPRLMSALSILGAASDPRDRAFALGRCQAFEDAAAQDLNEAMAHDSSGGARRALGAWPNRLSAAFAALSRHPENPALRLALIGVTDRIWRDDQRQLVQLLQARQDRLHQRFLRNLGLVALALGLTAALVIAMTRGLATRLRGLLGTMDRLNIRDTTADIPYLSDRNETGRIAATLAAFKNGLIESDEERRRAAEANAAVRESEARYRMLADNSTDVIVHQDRDFRILYMSPSAQRFGVDPAAYCGALAMDFIHPDDQAKVLRRREDALAGQAVRALETRLLAPDGQWIWIESTLAPILAPDGSIDSFITTLRDITERKAAELDLVQSEARYRMLAENSTDVIVHQDLNFQIKYLSPSARRYGIDPESYIGTATLAVVHPEDLERTMRRREDALAGKPVKPLEGRIRFPGGDWNWIESTLAPVQAADGSITGFITTLRDIAERKAAELDLVRSEARYRMLADNATDIIVHFNTEFSPTYASPSVRRYGIDPDALQGVSSLAFIHPDDIAKVLQRREDAMAGKAAKPIDYRVRLPDGQWTWVESAMAPVFGDDGAITGYIMTVRDIGERKAAEMALISSEARYRMLADNSTDIVIHRQRDLSITYMSPSARRYGFDPEAYIGLSKVDFAHPDDREALERRREDALAGKPGKPLESRLQLPNGEWMWTEGALAPVRAEDGSVTGFITTLRDIRERKAAELERVNSEARYRMLADNSTDVILLYNLEPTIDYVSPSIRQWGYRPEDFMGKPAGFFVHPEDSARVAERRAELLRGEQVGVLEARVRCADGRWIWIESNPALVQDDEGRTVGLLIAMRDITQRKAADQALIDSEARYRMLADNSTDIILSYGADAVTTYISPSVRQLGYTPQEFGRLPHGSIVHPDDWPKIAERSRAIFRGEPGGTVESRVRHADGRWVWLESSPAPIHDDAGAVVGIVSVLRDVSERKAAESALQDVNAELSRIARASALGAFAASIAHEVNQPLAAAVIDGETSLRWLSGDAPNLERAARAIQRATDNARRASEVVGRLRAMVVKEQTQRADFELNKAIGEVLALTAGESQRSNVTVTADLAADEPVVCGDRIQVQQVILNLVLNAIEAVRDTPKGERLVCVRSSALPNADVEITVEDRGAGVSPANAGRIFDNLFTTKIGGTGLGLPISKSIVEAHGGRMWVENAVPHGAVFRVRLPQGREVHARPGKPSRQAVPAP